MVACYNVEEVIDYITCPALSFLNSNLDNKTYKSIIRGKLRSGLNDIVIHMLDKNQPRESDIDRVVERIFTDLNAPNVEKDKEEITQHYKNLGNMLINHESWVTGSAIPIEMAYGGSIISTCIDMTIKNNKTGYITPVIVDFSKTRYEPFYNPVIYRCQMAADYLNVHNNNTQVEVFSLASGKKWKYEHKKYSNILSASLNENIRTMNDDRWPVRFGFWCATCSYRGVCHKLIDY